MFLQTKHLIIREFTIDDLDGLSSLLGNKEVIHFSLAGPLSREQVKDYLEKRILGHYAQFGFGLWAVVHSEEQRLIGYAGLMSQSIDGEDLIELGYRLDPRYWGKGLTSEAALAMAFKKTIQLCNLELHPNPQLRIKPSDSVDLVVTANVLKSDTLISLKKKPKKLH